MNIVNNYQAYPSVFMMLLCFFLVSCDSDGSSKRVQVTTLSVTVEGLPSTLPANVLVSGPDGFSETITSSETFRDIAAGTYQINAQPVAADIFQYLPNAESQTLAVVTGQSLDIDVNYVIEDALIEGEITGFGSVFVNGIELDTDSSMISTDDNDNDSESGLSVGMRVRVVARLGQDRESGIASFISYRAHIEGPVTLINLPESELVILGQVVNVDELTYFEGTAFDSLQIGDFVEVSAVESTDGLLATRIELVPAAESEYRLRGVVSSLDETLQEFTIGDLLVDYSQADIEGLLVNEAVVRISSDVGVINSVFVAEQVEVLVPLMEGKPENITGFITRFRSHQDFDVDGRPIMTNNTTMYQNRNANEMGLNVRVQLLGRRNEGDVIVASQIRFLHPVIVEVEGDIETIDLQTNSMQLLGNNILTDNNTRFVDHSDAHIRQFSLADLGIGDRVEIKASELESESFTLLARQLVRLNTDNEALTELSGEVMAIDQEMIRIQQTNIIVSAMTRFENAQYKVQTRQQFFNQLTTGNKLRVWGQLQADGKLLAIEVEIENEDDSNWVELSGIIDTLDTTDMLGSKSFTVNGHAVTTSEQTRFLWGNENNISVNAQVKIKGESNQNRVIMANKVEFDKDKSCQSSLEGTVDELVLTNHIIVNGVTVVFSAQTDFEGGTSDDIAIGVNIEVIGCVNDAGYIIADAIKLLEN